MSIRPNYALIDLDALRENLMTLRAGLHPGVKFLAVIKANAYGHGIIEVGRAAADCGADFLGVAIPEEGERLRQAGVQTPILVLGGLLPESAELVVQHDLRPTVFSCEILTALQRFASQQGKVCPIHIKVDTGMNRIGVKTPEELEAILSMARTCENISVEGLFTHFAVSEIADKTFTLQQAQRFENFAALTRKMGFSPMLHASNSGGTLDLPQLQFDMVRVGIAMYGVHPGPGCGKDVPLHPVLTWKTHVVHIKNIQPGDTVSYGRTYMAGSTRRVATLPVGYGDGYKRCLSNGAQVLIHGLRAPVIGAVCMDQLMVDVTDIPDVGLGDEAVLLGRQGEGNISADEMAGWADTISYEVLLSINDRVPRVYIG